jgi:signal transduction histidine kinase/DNA-binding response OmpR family regulator
MNNSKNNIPFKIVISYMALALMIAVVSWVLYSENKVFSKTEKKIALENAKILKVSGLVSDLYKTESLARITIQTNSLSDFQNYLVKNTELKLQIDSLKLNIKNNYQIKLLDSIQLLLLRKTENIKQLKIIKSRPTKEIAVKNAIQDLTKMESSLRKLQLEDFVKYPEAMGDYQRGVLKKYVAYLNQNIPDDSTNTMTKKASDSILYASKKLLTSVKSETVKIKKEASFEEKLLLNNEISTSEQLRKILNIIEKEIIVNTAKNNLEKDQSLRKTNQIISIAAIIGLFLALFFSILIIKDFSKTELYKKQLEIANSKTNKLLKNREQLISTVSHDLKTPLSTIVGFTELLGGSKLDEKQNYFTENIKNSSQYITQLVQDLLDFTQIEAGKIVVENVPFSLSNLIQETANNIHSIHNHKPLELLIQVDPKLKTNINGDAFRLKQVLTNIIGNAFKFTEKGFVKIEAKIDPSNQKIIIKIEDTGIGIEEKNLNLVFEEFTQANENIEKTHGGTGLGLTISKKIIEILNGTITLKSEFGKGSVFKILLPLNFEKLIAETTKSETTKQQIVVVIDDDLSLLNLTSEVLKSNNYIVHAFSDANSALEKIKTIVFDFIITDIQMPGIDGFEFLEKLIKAKEYKNQPVFALTGRTDLDLEIYKNSGFSKVIFKPYSPKKFLETINLVLNSNENIPEIEEELSEEKSKQLYTLNYLKLFFNDDTIALNEVLNTFIMATKSNLKDLKVAVSDENDLQVQQIAHRMCPMFKQIKASEVFEILEKLERNTLSKPDLEIQIELLQEKITIVFTQLENELTLSE